MRVSAVWWSVREAWSKRSWIYFSWDKKNPSYVEEISIPRKYLNRTKIRHKKLITKTSLNKGNVLRVITRDDHVIHIKKEKSPTMRWHMDEESRIMSAGGKTNNCDQAGSWALAEKPTTVTTEAKCWNQA
jgi:hypothetical protein